MRTLRQSRERDESCRCSLRPQRKSASRLGPRLCVLGPRQYRTTSSLHMSRYRAVFEPNGDEFPGPFGTPLKPCLAAIRWKKRVQWRQTRCARLWVVISTIGAQCPFETKNAKEWSSSPRYRLYESRASE